MAKTPVGRWTRCPSCNGEAVAIVPKNSQLVQREENSDGKVRVKCRNCGKAFVAYYQLDS